MIMLFLIIFGLVAAELFSFDVVKDTYIHSNPRLTSINEGGNAFMEVGQNSMTLLSFDPIGWIDRKLISTVKLRIPVHNVGPYRFTGVVNSLIKDFKEGNGMRFLSSIIKQDLDGGVTYDNYKPILYRSDKNHPGSVFSIPNHHVGYVDIDMTYLFKKTSIFANGNVGFIIRKFDSNQNDGYLRLISKENHIDMRSQLIIETDTDEVEIPDHISTHIEDVDGRGKLYDRGVIRNIYINTTDPSEWQNMNINSEDYIEGTDGAPMTAIIDGDELSGYLHIAGTYDEWRYCTYYGAGGSLNPSACRKFGLLMNLTSTYYGVNFMRLHAEHMLYKVLYSGQGLTIENGDKANYIAQMEALTFRYSYGMDLSQMSNFVRVWMNGEYIGLFNSLEYQPDSTFTKDRFWYGQYEGRGDMIFERGFFTPQTTDTDSNDGYWFEKTIQGEVSTYADFVKVGYDVEFQDPLEMQEYIESTFESNDWHNEHIAQIITHDWNQGPIHFYFGFSYYPIPSPPPCMTFLDLSLSDQMYYNDTYRIRRYGHDVDMAYSRVMTDIFNYSFWYDQPRDCTGSTITAAINFPFPNGNSICQVGTQCFTMGKVWKDYFYSDYAIKGLDVIDKVYTTDQIHQSVDRIIDLVMDLAVDEESLGGTSVSDLTEPITGTWDSIKSRIVANVVLAKAHFESI
jgi:hypothetical protein